MSFQKQIEIPFYQSHRGVRQEGLKENTLEAFRKAKENGFSMVELDVRLSQDGVPIVCHDRSLLRVFGKPLGVDKSSAKVLQSYGLPTLKEVLEDPKVCEYVNIEIKSLAMESWAITNLVVEVLKSNSKKCIVSSFNPLVLLILKWKMPKIPRALLVTQAPEKHNYYFLRKMWFLKLVKPQYLNLDLADLSLERVEKFKQEGYKVIAWTCKSESDQHRAISYGVSGLITDLYQCH